MKRILAFVFALTMAMTLSLSAFAADYPDEDVPDEITGESQFEEIGGLEETEENISSGVNDFLGAEPTEQNEQTASDTAEQAATDAATSPETTPASAPATLVPAKTVQGDTPANQTTLTIIIVCGAVLLLLLILFAALLLRRKNSSSGGEAPGYPVTAHGTTVQIEVLSGLCYNASLSFKLRRNLTIGCDRGCDLVFDDAKMLAMHAVISRTPEGIILSECADTGNTYIGGMKIFASNRLRSGDIVTIGSTSFRVWFDS